MLQTYVEAKETLGTYSKYLLDLAKKNDLRTVIQDLESIEKRLIDDRFQLVVVGMFSRGKSTFVDALLGKRLLPTSKKPTTAVISKITYGDKPAFFLHYKDECLSQEISEDEFFNLTASNTEGDEEAESEIERISCAEVQYPLSFCQHGVELVDTPGTNDLNQARVEITYQYLNKADAVIMLLAADQALSTGEVEFLKERIIKNQISDIFFIVNRKDTLAGPEEENRVLAFIKDNLLRIVGASFSEKLHIHLVSSYQALLFRRQFNGESLTSKQLMKIPNDFEDTGFPALEKDLAKFLEEDKGRIKLRRFSVFLAKQIHIMESFLSDKKVIISHLTDDLDHSIHELKKSIGRTKLLVKDIIRNIRLDFDQSKELVMDHCKIALVKILEEMKISTSNYSGDYDSKELQTFVRNQFEITSKYIIDDVSAYQEKLVQNIYQKVEERIETFFATLDKQYKETLNLSSDGSILHLDDIQSLILQEEGEFEEEVSKTIYRALKDYYSDMDHNFILRGIAQFLADITSSTLEDELKQMIDEAYPEWSKRIEEHIVSQYEIYTTKIVDRVDRIANSQLDELARQLEVLYQERKVQGDEKEKILEGLRNDIKKLDDIKSSLGIVI